ncbi:Etoposide-induced protein 2.4 (EI24) [Sulfurivirga caldicuralii]|uniref:Etoposide-induced protein 2.4 (EI24) n=1 Tax=Sulfurivirga caldicuralii TaxID=364032 RepID=A0A1N6DNY8_9GAMM|nr:EI24 domain-containing protein [Sulfurivirga caldicuralii]SIN72512.1 Etoposide-induced protein 2.4 (EI24) [Sulfurivirga caldicuralii]
MWLDILFRTLGDLRDPRILMRLFVPFVAGVIVVSLLGYGVFGFLLTSDWVHQLPIVQDFEQWVDSAEQSLQAIPLIGALLVWLISALAAVTAGLMGLLLGSYLVLLFAMIITGFMTDTLVKVVREKHYPGLVFRGDASLTWMLGRVLWYGLLLLLLLIVTLPILLVPVLNVVWFWWIGFLFFRYSMMLDAGSIILPKQLLMEEMPVTNWTPTLIMMVFYLLAALPLLSLFAPMLAVIALAHYFCERLTVHEASGRV